MFRAQEKRIAENQSDNSPAHVALQIYIYIAEYVALLK